jgi:hypothetical protein
MAANFSLNRMMPVVGFGKTSGPKEKGKRSLDRCHQDELTLQLNPTILLTGISRWQVFFRSHCAAYGVGVGTEHPAKP